MLLSVKARTKKVTLSSNKPTWRGVPRVYMIWHGNWSDPELELVRGCFSCIANYFDVEDAMYADFKEYIKEENMNLTPDSDEEEEAFDKFCVENKDLVYMYLQNAGKWNKQ